MNKYENMKKYTTEDDRLLKLTDEHMAQYIQTIGEERIPLALMEECGELFQVVSKLRRDRLAGKQQSCEKIANLQEEIAHVLMAVQTVMYQYHLSPNGINHEILRSLDKFYSGMEG